MTLEAFVKKYRYKSIVELRDLTKILEKENIHYVVDAVVPYHSRIPEMLAIYFDGQTCYYDYPVYSPFTGQQVSLFVEQFLYQAWYIDHWSYSKISIIQNDMEYGLRLLFSTLSEAVVFDHNFDFEVGLYHKTKEYIITHQNYLEKNEKR